MAKRRKKRKHVVSSIEELISYLKSLPKTTKPGRSRPRLIIEDAPYLTWITVISNSTGMFVRPVIGWHRIIELWHRGQHWDYEIKRNPGDGGDLFVRDLSDLELSARRVHARIERHNHWEL